MNNFSKRNGSKSNNIIFMVFVCFMLSNFVAFAQTTIEENDAPSTSIENNVIVNNNVEINSMKQEAASGVSNMNFVLWFMGSKQDPNVKILPAAGNTRKQFMTSGTAPNRLLIKAFLKKAVNFEVAAA